jgi:hypothetical protein
MDLDGYLAAIADPPDPQHLSIPTLTTIAGRVYDLWTTAVPVGVAPTTAVVPTRATAGALGQPDGGAGRLSLVAGRMNLRNPGVIILADRLSHQGGLSGTSGVAQTTNLPTAALTRHTGGVGVMIGLSIYTLIGTSSVTISATYTNSGGTGSRVTPNVQWGNTGFREAGRMILLPLQAGDVGVQSVQSVTAAATTGTTGNFGVTLFKPLAAFVVDDMNGISQPFDLISGGLIGAGAEVIDDACLFMVAVNQSTSVQGAGTVMLAEV